MVSAALAGRLCAAALSRRRARISEHDEVAQPDWRDDAERDPLDAVGQERSRVQVRQPDHTETARLTLHELQIGAGQWDVQQRGDLRGVDRVHLLRSVRPERCLALRVKARSRAASR